MGYSRVDWGNRLMRYPIAHESFVHPPQGAPYQLPRIQHDFSRNPKDETREETLAVRRDSIRDAVKKSWAGYRRYAWGYDELRPLSQSRVDTYGGWGVTLVDSLDTLWIMGLEDEFREAVQAIALLDWNDRTTRSCSLFETNIRYLGGLLSAYDLSGERILLSKALDLGNMLYAAFDTPNHLPANILDFGKAKTGRLVPDIRESFAAMATLSLEFTRLSQLTGDPKFYTVIDGIKHELNRTQDATRLPGMWPIYVNLKKDFVVDGSTFTLGAQADSGYEYLPKMYALLGGLDETYATMHKKAMETARKHLLFRAMIPEEGRPDVLFSGTTLVTGKEGRTVELIPRLQHLGCFAGGHFALGGKLFGLEGHVEIGELLARGCAWAYGALPSGIMPELSTLVPCKTAGLAQCEWDEERWRKKKEPKAQELPRGFRQIRDPRYLLRPEAIESLFVLYRVTGKRELQDMAWDMFQAIKNATETSYGFASVDDVRVVPPVKLDSMESFWIAETLKYLYLIFSEPDLISLDDYVFNTEAHPFRIPKPGDKTLPETNSTRVWTAA
ncbi:glycoside hydrolase family 47 protein [Coniochaeta ligniaria NRRL 30616]|uniref:alpha-1,2-Mannosidase n=1 Tax=Coniochaeta ligniaria NRRL 30616 TaxID=1408157 RepID=A0A1J7I9X6_9PEZI|nr:glycoside hydrolase family 47 protein [Coniochaeta ligniaria NRRL 30616]